MFEKFQLVFLSYFLIGGYVCWFDLVSNENVYIFEFMLVVFDRCLGGIRYVFFWRIKYFFIKKNWLIKYDLILISIFCQRKSYFCVYWEDIYFVNYFE